MVGEIEISEIWNWLISKENYIDFFFVISRNIMKFFYYFHDVSRLTVLVDFCWRWGSLKQLLNRFCNDLLSFVNILIILNQYSSTLIFIYSNQQFRSDII